MSIIIDEIGKIGIVPVIALDYTKDAKPLAKALCDGGLPCAEITFRTAAAEESIRIMSEEFPEMLVGAGTVLTTEQVDKAVNAGAKFIVSPGLNTKIVCYCTEKGIPVIPGCANPSDVEAAIELGLDVVKFFPAEQAGGINMIKAMSAPYSGIRFMPTGGINPENLKSYLDFSKIVACGGSWMVGRELVANGEFEKITELTKQAVAGMLGFEVVHVGINTVDAESANNIAQYFSNFFGFVKNENPNSIFASRGIEVMKKPFLGAMGHIAIGTNYMQRAIYHLEKSGVQFDMDTAKTDANGNIMALYLKGEFGGFAVHLLQK